MMISVMNNDFDLERNQASVNEAEEPRVSNDGSVALLNERDESLIEEIRVTSGHDLGTWKSEIDETRVLPRPGQEGNYASITGETHCRVNGDSGNLARVESSSENDTVDGDREVESRVRGEESTDAQNEVVTPEAGVIGSSDDHTEGIRASNSDAVGDGKLTATCNDVGLERRGDLRASESSDVGPSDLNAVIRSGSMKVSSSAFEMGDMVWGKVKSHPWWPGHIFSEAFATSLVRRTRRDGHVLVAFFGDSSYGWFDPTELVPYDHNYAEKSQQTSSRSFMKAVEESVDEASRRSALGLSCRCRNPFNFRPTNVPGYLAVDVVDYERGAIYSVRQIQKARECFLPSATLSFIKQSAAAPMSGESKSLDCIKQKAIALAYRRSTYEEFDETYAQAFGQEPVHRPELPQPSTDKEPSRAPLSGPLVFAEALGGRKSSTKATKPKDLSKKDNYLFKRRDEAGGLRTTRINQVHASFSLSSAHDDGIYDKAAASYVFQKRDHAISTNDDLVGTPTRDQVDHMTTKDSPAGLGMEIGPDVSGKRLSSDVTGVPQQSEPSAGMTVEVTGVHGHVPGSHISNIISTDAGPVKKKKKVAKRPAGEKPDMSEKKKQKKLRKTDDERLPMQITASSREDSQVSNQKKDDEVSNLVPQQVGSMSLEAAREREVELLRMLADLKGLALNPFHGAERNRPAITRQFFLKFRSLVFLKASSAFSTSESEPSEARATRFPEPAEKPPKPSARQDDPTKGRGRKRLPSERQEEITTKRLKKITEVKSLSGEKRALLKNAEMVRVDGKVGPTKKVDRPPRVEEPTYMVMKFQSGSSLPSLAELKARFARFGPLDTSLSRVFYKTNMCRVAFLYKQDANVAYRYAVGSKSVFSNVKFMLRPVAAPEPPQQPSSTGRAEDLQGEPASNRDSSAVEPTPLMHQKSAQELKSCLKKPLVGDEPTGPTNGGTVRTPRVRFNVGEEKDGNISNRGGGVQMQMESRNATSASSSSEGGPSCSSSSSSVAMDIVSNNQRFPSLLPLQPPSIPHPPQFPRVPNPFNHPPPQHVEVIPINNFNYNLTSTTRPPALPPRPPPPSMDISQQMMSLLTRCHDVVTNVESMLGYVPYHPL